MKFYIVESSGVDQEDYLLESDKINLKNEEGSVELKSVENRYLEPGKQYEIKIEVFVNCEINTVYEFKIHREKTSDGYKIK
jgi:hypothetical protein